MNVKTSCRWACWHRKYVRRYPRSKFLNCLDCSSLDIIELPARVVEVSEKKTRSLVGVVSAMVDINTQQHLTLLQKKPKEKTTQLPTQIKETDCCCPLP